MTTIDCPLNPPPSVFEKLIEPVADFIQKQDQQLPKHPNQKLFYIDFFRLLLYFYVSGSESLKLFIKTRLNSGLLSPSLGLCPVPYTTCLDAFDRFSPDLFQAVFRHLLTNFPFKSVPEFVTLGTLCCIDGSLFPVIQSMAWASYTSTHQALKLHLCFELNRMIPVDFQVGSGNSSERTALISMAQAGVTYIADRGYMSFALCHQLVQKQAHFILRVKTNLLYYVLEPLKVTLPESVRSLFQNVTDEIIRYTNDENHGVYRLVRFSIDGENYFILTDRRGLTTFQIIMLYAYRWQIELMFRFLKRTLNGIHLVKHDERGVTIQFYMILIVALLELFMRQSVLDSAGARDDNTEPHVSPSKDSEVKTASSRLDGVEFVATLGRKIKKYWKIGIHWLTALRDLLIEPFNERAIRILANTS